MIRTALSQDLSGIKALLEEASLPLEGVKEHLGTFLVEERAGEIIGVMGLELYGETALLRSAAVLQSEQGKGVGTGLFARLVSLARSCGVRRLILLTTTAQEYFARKGFKVVEKSSVRGPVTQSTEFTGACPKEAVVMQCDL